ncbi:hypothetical protein [Sphingomonas baiyangensis]|uniref:Uncharacterized protein n=1 Tax=Sphingomonas baiyangensis TaxID=2572576 RepID=A0A4U1L331_9SPHN|nr:hypothetical protein [Sphingomonas baiyangensis]TKD50603.1 hypothetical protein FBR43_07360 [Sphingomonas baiyangensis]
MERDAKAESLHAAVQGRINRLRLERKSLLNDLKADLAVKRAELGGLAGDSSDLAMLRTGLAALIHRRISAIDAEYHDRIAALRQLRGEIDEADDLNLEALDNLAAPDCSLVIDWAARPAIGIPPTGSSPFRWVRRYNTGGMTCAAGRQPLSNATTASGSTTALMMLSVPR